ncbi:MAG TPA: hypothetical protein VES95_03415 [Dermatophilaceae bacterium]|nr:hypothetical protein [Dermatophilaceae bacterium]
MDSSNHWYGHAHVLARYCGLPDDPPPRINGVLQHGWTFVHGFGYGHAPPLGFTRYVWSDFCRSRGQMIGWRDYYVIGAPFLYLQQLEPAPAETEQEREGTIWYPFHGTADYEGLGGSHEDLIAEIRATETGPVTACLYYVEYDDPVVRAAYEDAGFRVICHGVRGAKWSGGTTDFLSRQLRELRRHRRVASNRLTTAIFYGISAGCEPAVYGNPMELLDVKEGFDGAGLIEANYADLHGAEVDREVAQAIADAELGVGWTLPPEEMRVMFGWEALHEETSA